MFRVAAADGDEGNRSEGGGREPPPRHDGNMRRIHATNQTRRRTKQSRVLVNSPHRGAKDAIRPGQKTVPEGPPRTTPRRGRSLFVLPSIPRATALAAKGDQDREGPCLVEPGRSIRLRPMGKTIQDGDAKTSREGSPGYDGDGIGVTTGGHRDAPPSARGHCGNSHGKQRGR